MIRLAAGWHPASYVHEGVRYERGHAPERIPLPCTLPGEGNVAVPGTIPPEVADFLPVLVDLAHRIAPWVAVHFVPAILFRCDPGRYVSPGLVVERDGDLWSPGGGLFVPDTEEVWIAAHHGARLFDVVCHELWHAIEWRLAEEIVESVDMDLAPIVYGGSNPYLVKPGERRARAFAAFCAPLLEGLGQPYRHSRATILFNDVWTGKAGTILGR